MASQLQIDANRQNAQKSTGPKTPEGKAAVRRNAVTHGLTANNVCIDGEDQDEFDETRQSFEDELKPVGPLQTLLVQQIVMAAWHLGHLRLLESGLSQLRAADDERAIERTYTRITPRTRLAYLYQRDVQGPNALTTLGRYQTRIERSFYRALHELQRLQAAGPSAPIAPAPASRNDPAKQSQIAPDSAPNPAPQQDLTPPSDDHPNSKSPNPQSSRPPIVYNGNIHESSRLRIAQAHCP